MAKEALAIFEPAIQARICVPQSVGEFIIQRQIYTLQTLNILIDDILSGSQTRIQKAPPKKKKATDDGATVAMSRLSIKGPQTRLRLSDLVARARDHQDTLEEYWVCYPLSLLCLLMLSIFGSLAAQNSFPTKRDGDCRFTLINTSVLLFLRLSTVRSKEPPSGNTLLVFLGCLTSVLGMMPLELFSSRRSPTYVK